MEPYEQSGMNKRTKETRVVEIITTVNYSKSCSTFTIKR